VSIERLLAALEGARRLRPSRGRVEKAIAAAAGARFLQATDLARFHEALLFLRAYPQNRRILAMSQKMLQAIPARVARLEERDADVSILDDLELAGMAGSIVATEFSYDIARWLAAHAPRVDVSWDVHEQPDRLGEGLPRFLPLLEEEALADAIVPYLEWLASARRRGERDLPWLVERFERLPLSPRQRSELFDALGIVVSWSLGRSRYSRTLLRVSGPSPLFHNRPLLSRRDVDFAAIVGGPPLPVRRLSRREGERMLDVARGTTAARYREFYGFTHGDPATALAARPGRGTEIFFFGARPDRRLPLRATHTAMVFVNGVAVAYYEGLSIFERMEAGFNIYYTFREGESAWIYAQVLRLCRQVAGVTSFSVDAYQIGYQNPEAIESGAFWFYRKLGFRPTDPDVARIVAVEEERLAARPGYRTPERTLRRIATCNLLYEVGRREAEGGRRGTTSDWDRFHVRRIGLAVNRRMAREFAGDAGRLRLASAQRVARVLGVSTRRWPPLERDFFESWALVLDLIPDLASWTRDEKADLAAVVRAKAGRDETRYLRRMRRHARLRAALLRLGGGRPIYNL
jgi:hypothetical protein